MLPKGLTAYCARYRCHAGVWIVTLGCFAMVQSVLTDSLNQGQGQHRMNPHFSIGVDWVTLHVLATDRQRRFVAGLHADDFRVYEDGALQKIALFREQDVPVTVGIVVDNSGSMKARRNAVISALLALARASNPDDEMFTVNFNERVWFGLPHGVMFTNELGQLDAALSSMTADGMTALYDAVATALDRLRDGTRDRRALVIVGDGGDNASHHTIDDVLAMAADRAATIYAVGLIAPNRADVNPSVLRKLARVTGGEAFFPNADSDLEPICTRIAREIRNEYTIGYSSTNETHDGKYRRIRVIARAPGRGPVTIRTRPGYFARW
jgi:Ca-activated chloride channel family protein